MRVDVSIGGDRQVSRQLLRFGERAVAARPAFEMIGELLFELEKEQFASEGGRASGGGAPLAESTVASRGSSHPILDLTGELRSSLTGRGPNNTFLATDDFLLFGTSVEYAGFHQAGTSRMPRRRVLELTEADRVAAAKVLQRFIVTGELGGSTLSLAGELSA
jgi:phage gpG-like protein